MCSKFNDNYFYSDLCSAETYAHLKNSTDIIFGQNIIVGLKVKIDTNHHTYLQDHIFGGDCFVPATMIIELFVEAACWFAENHLHWDNKSYFLSGLEDLVIERAIAINPGNSLDICIQLMNVEQTEGYNSMKIDIISKRVNSFGKAIGRRLNATCRVLFSDTLPSSEPVEIPHCKYNYYDINSENYYKFYFPSLGPLFQSGTGRFAVNEDANILIGEYDCKNNEEIFIEGQKSKFIISPLGYDSCVQYTVFLSRIITIKGRLPVGAKKISIFRKHEPSGRYKVLVKCLKIDEEIMLGDFWLFDNNGSVIMSAEEFAVQKSPFHKYDDRVTFGKLLKDNWVKRLDW